MPDTDPDRAGTPDPAGDAGADEQLIAWAQAVADGRAVDWEGLRSKAPDLAASISALRLVETVITAHRAPEAPGAGPVSSPGGSIDPGRAPGGRPWFPPLPADAAWGPLRLLEKVGEGTFGDVYRAFDPVLQIDVAVKILRRSARDQTAAERYFDEARRLARVRHPNVLRVHGAATHEGKVGIWSELVKGRTLEDCIATEGPFGPHEAAVIGIDLCSGVAAVHRAGLLHRDLKTQNVMRERGGRVVLMDFGSVSEVAGTPGRHGTAYGTPLTIAPELLRGEPATPATDVYALGVLLYRLVSGAYPIDASTLVELIDRHRRGEWKPLLESRPDLPAEFVKVVEKALDPDPKRRYPGPTALERALKETVDAVDAAAGGGRLPAWIRPLGVGIAAMLAVAAGLLVVDVSDHVLEHARGGTQVRPDTASSPTGGRTVAPGAMATTPVSGADAGLTASARLYRVRGGASEMLSADAVVSRADGLYMEVECDEPMYVYVLGEDEAGRLVVLFPLDDLEPRNPLPGGARHRLPGSRRGRHENWQGIPVEGREEVVVIGSRAALPDLERDVADAPRAGRGAPVSHGASPAGSPRLGTILRDLTVKDPHHHDIWVWQIALGERR